MPVINIEVLQDIWGGSQDVDARITATVNRASIDAYRVNNQFVIFPRDLIIPVVNGFPTQPFVLTALPPSYYWNIDIFVSGEAPVRRTVIVPGNVGPYDFDELVDVLPETALPDVGTDAATAYAALVESYAVRAEAATPYISVPVPTSSLGQSGDVAGRVADNSTYHYFCTGTYDGATNIWKRVAWSNNTW